MNEPLPKKSLGQHWLSDETALQAIVDAAQLTPSDTVLEIGPGQGTLTALLVKAAEQVIAVEFDPYLAADLPRRVPTANLQVKQQDILSFDFTSLPPDYIIVANIPYYLTSNLIRVLSETTNRPKLAVLLVQQEVAERVTAAPGDMSVLSITAQYYWQVSRGITVPADLFTPPPKVDSQVLILRRRDEELFSDVDPRTYFRLVKAGFGERRKKLRSSLGHGLHISTQEVESILNKASIDPNLRAQALSLEDWHRLYEAINT